MDKLIRILGTILILIPALLTAQIKEISFWHSMTGEKGALLEAFVREFNERPEIKGQWKIRTQFIGTYIEGLHKIRTALLAHRIPHLAQVFEVGTRVMIDTESVVPLANFIKGDKTFPYDDILPQIRRYYEIKGELYSLPFATSNPILYYNLDSFKKKNIAAAPKTFSELEDVCLKLTDSKSGQTGLTWPLHSWFFEQFMAKQGVALLNQENGRKAAPTELQIASPEAKAFLSLWKRLVESGCFANVGRGWDPAEQNFLAGRTHMLITSTSDVFEIGKKAPFRVGYAPLPAAISGQSGGTIIGGNSLWIFKEKPIAEQRIAYEFIKHMASVGVQERWHRATGYFPIRGEVIRKLRASGFYDDNPGAWVAIKQLQDSAQIAATQGALLGVFQEVREYIESAIEGALAGKGTIDETLSEAKEKGEKAMQRYYRKRAG